MTHILITGASSGIGAEMAKCFSKRGFRVSLIARRETKLEAVSEHCNSLGGTCCWHTGDVADPNSLGKAMDALVEQQGPIDIFIGNAGTSHPTAATRIKSGRIGQIMRVNFDGVIQGIEHTLPPMLKRGHGHIVAVSSPAGFRSVPNEGAYCASKAALSTIMEAFAMELEPYGITVTTVHPGFVDTEMTQKVKVPMPFLLSPERAAARIVKGILKKKRRIDFPRRTILLARIGQLLPSAVYFPLLRLFYPVPPPKHLKP